MKLPVYNQQGEQLEEIELNSSVFDVTPEITLIEEAVRTQLANRRDTISATKTRAEVRGGGKKPWKQKGTGRARHGSIRSPIWAGGGITFGPRSDRNWSLKMNKSAYRKALFMALTDKVRNNSFVVVDGLKAEEAKTKALSASLKNLAEKTKITGRSMLLVLGGKDESVERAGRNMASAELIQATNLNVYDIVKSHSLIVSKDALQAIEKHFAKKD